MELNLKRMDIEYTLLNKLAFHTAMPSLSQAVIARWNNDFNYHICKWFQYFARIWKSRHLSLMSKFIPFEYCSRVHYWLPYLNQWFYSVNAPTIICARLQRELYNNTSKYNVIAPITHCKWGLPTYRVRSSTVYQPQENTNRLPQTSPLAPKKVSSGNKVRKVPHATNQVDLPLKFLALSRSNMGPTAKRLWQVRLYA